MPALTKASLTVIARCSLQRLLTLALPVPLSAYPVIVTDFDGRYTVTLENRISEDVLVLRLAATEKAGEYTVEGKVKQRKYEKRKKVKQIMGPGALFIEMTWNTKRRIGKPRTAPILDAY